MYDVGQYRTITPEQVAEIQQKFAEGCPMDRLGCLYGLLRIQVYELTHGLTKKSK